MGGGFGGTAGVWGGTALADRVAQPGSILAILLTLAMAGLSAGAMAWLLRAWHRRRAA